jgi:transcription-repair coupling factor (superfamily II helicase)
LPEEAQVLLKVAALRAQAKALGITELVSTGKYLRITPLPLPESKQLRLTRLYPGSLYKNATDSVMVTIPKPSGWSPSNLSPQMGDTSLLVWISTALEELTTKERKP